MLTRQSQNKSKKSAIADKAFVKMTAGTSLSTALYTPIHESLLEAPLQEPQFKTESRISIYDNILKQPSHQLHHYQSIHQLSIVTCENIIVQAMDELKDYIRRGSSFDSIVKYIEATILPIDNSLSLRKKLGTIVALSLKSLVLQGLVANPNGLNKYQWTNMFKRKRFKSIERYHMLQTQCRNRLFHRFEVHPLKDRAFYIDTAKAMRKSFITKCKLSDSKVLTVSPRLMSKNWMDVDQKRKKPRFRQRSISLVKTELLLKKRIILTT